MSSLFTADFPPYTIFSLREGEFYIAGGGGTAKTGVPNALEIRSLVYDGSGFVSHQVHRHDMADHLVMNSHPHPSDLCTVAVGVGAECKFLKAKDKGRSADRVEELRNFSLEESGSIRTDFAPGADCYQKVVRFCRDGSKLVTGGMEGVVRVWRYPVLKQLFELRGHKSEIEDISCHPTDFKAVSVCRGGVLCVWDLVRGTKEQEITWSPTQSAQYRFRACCFSPRKDGNGSLSFYSINIPVKWNQRSKQACYLTKWDSSTWKQLARQKTGKELLSTMAVSSSGENIGVGSAEGSVAIYSKNLKVLVRVPNMHGFVVTSLAFVFAKSNTKDTADKLKSMDQSREALLSISADKSCCATTVAGSKGGVGLCSCSVSAGLFVLLPLFCLFVAIIFMWALII